MEHSFNVEIATKYGIEEAIIYNHLLFWIIKNKSDGRNYKDGRYWTYTTYKSMSRVLPYLNINKIKYAIKKLVDAGVLIKANYNTNPYDTTNWYAFNEEPEALKNIPDTDSAVQEDENNYSCIEGENSPLEETNDVFLCHREKKFSVKRDNFSPHERKNSPSNKYIYNINASNPDTLTNNNTGVCNVDTHKNCEVQATHTHDLVSELLNKPDWTWRSFKLAYLFWFTKLTGRPVSDLVHTVSARPESLQKLEWLENNFNNRTVNAGVAIFETLETIAQDKSCDNNFDFRASNYINGVVSRLVDYKLAKTDPKDNEGTNCYINPTFDYFVY